MLYSVLKQGLSDTKPKFYPLGKPPKLLDVKKDHYLSLFYYTEEQKEAIERAGTLSVVKSTVTNRIYFDFDSQENLEQARQETLDLAFRLVNDYGIEPSALNVCFTGNKGFSLEFYLNKFINNTQFKKLVHNLASQYTCFDLSVSDHNRIVSVPNTLHRNKQAYKIPLSLEELESLSMEEIQKLAQKPRTFQHVFETPEQTLPEAVIPPIEETKEVKPVIQDWDLQKAIENKPRHWKDYKWALAQGFFEAGERHNALMVVAATCRALGYDKDIAIKICESAIEKQASRTNKEPFDKEELVDNIIERSVYSDTWQGGQYSPETNPWLKSYCERQGFKVEEDKKVVLSIDETFNFFKDYAKNIDNLTIKSGIPALDRKLRMTVGMSVGLLAPPSAGKTSIALQILNNMSNNDELCIFFSYDMYKNHVYQKLAQRHLKLSEEELFELFKNGGLPDKEEELRAIVNEEYKNVGFCFEAGQDMNAILRTIKQTEDKFGKKVKFIVVDYNELVITDKSDPTASSAYVAQKMREIAVSEQLCALSLFQPSKAAGSPSDPLLSYRSAKGSSAIEQSLSIMLGLYRPGFDPRYPGDDRFATINCLKNRMGTLFSLDLSWNGLTGTVSDLSQEGKAHLEDVRRRKAEEEEKQSGSWS